MPFDFSLVSAPFRMQPGLRRIEPGARQLTPSAPNGRHLREKLAVLGAFSDQALCAVEGCDATPVLRALAHEASLHRPLAFEFDGANDHAAAPRCRAPMLGWSIVDGAPVGEGDPAIGALLASLPPARRCTALLCLAFEEDFALVDGASAAIPWLAVCLPSRWAPEDKVGRHFAQVHAPVADNAVLLAASESLARLVTGDERWERFVWTISADPRLHQHPARGSVDWPAALDADELAASACFRSERQTFIPLPGSKQAIFTIHVESRPLVEAVTTDDAARRLGDAIATMTPAVLAYRSLGAAHDRLLAWLASRSGRDGPATPAAP